MPAGEQTTTTNTQAKPYGKAKPLINMALKDSMRAYKQGIGSKTFKGSTVVPMANQTTEAYGNIMDQARANSGGLGMSGGLNEIMQNRGFNQEQRGALDQMKQVANSEYSMDVNPGFRNILEKAQNDARHQVGLSASAMGRYGSAIDQGNVAREVGNVTDRMVSEDYNRFLGRKDAATNNMFNAAQVGLGNMQGAYAAAQQPSQSMLGVGAAYEDLNKRVKDDRLRVFNDRQNAPWSQFGRLMGMGSLTGQYAPSSSVSVAPGPNPLLAGLSTAPSGVGLLGGLGLF